MLVSMQVTVYSGATVQIGCLSSFMGAVSNAGTMQVYGGSTTFALSVTNSASGIILVTGSAATSVTMTQGISNSGAFAVNGAGSSIRISAGVSNNFGATFTVQLANTISIQSLTNSGTAVLTAALGGATFASTVSVACFLISVVLAH